MKLFLFDVDSTLINEEVIDLMAAQAGVEKEVAQITERAMAGEVGFCHLPKRTRLTAQWNF
jgi:phosphoserine phosphatase